MRRCESCRRRHPLYGAQASCPNQTPRSQTRDARDARRASRASCPLRVRRRECLGETTALTFLVTYLRTARHSRHRAFLIRRCRNRGIAIGAVRTEASVPSRRIAFLAVFAFCAQSRPVQSLRSGSG
jgi:hypothetical protein